VIENEFGETGVDEEILVAREHSDAVMIEVQNGCICCTVRGDLVKCLQRLYNEKGDSLDGVIIETTGLADPAPVCQTFFVEQTIAPLFKIDAILTVVDAKHLIQHLKEEKAEGVENEAVEQVAFADKILLNKTDLVTPEYLETVKKEIKAINSYCDIIPCQFKTAPPDMKELLDLDAFDLKRVTEMDEEFLNTDAEHQHDSSVSSVGFNLGPDEQINMYALNRFIGKLLRTYANDLFRYKGVVAVKGMDQKWIFQGVHMLFMGDFAADWGENEERKSCFCFIGKKIDEMELEKGFRDCIAIPLRFDIGQRVRARVEGGYQSGEVIKKWDEGNAYRIRLDNGDEVWAPIDDDLCVHTRDPVPKRSNEDDGGNDAKKQRTE